MIKGIISDLDGTLLDSMEARLDAWTGAFKKFNVEVPRKELRPLIGLPGMDLAGKYYERPEKIEEAEEQLFDEKLPGVDLFPDVVPTFQLLMGKGIRIVIVTSGRRELVSRINLPVRDIITIDDVTVGKPHTEPYEKAMEILNLKSGNILVVGDSQNDMIPAKKLGIIAVLVKHGDQVISEYADYMIDEIGELPKLIDHINRQSPD